MASNCLGLSILGLCSYDPASPAQIYFTLGDAVAALTLTLLIPQFLKPIYIFRLRVRRISLVAIYGIVFGGAALVAFAALIPNLPLPRVWPFAYPLLWELSGAALFGAAYGLLAFGSIRPVVVRTGAVAVFAKGVAEFLANGSDSDFVEIVEDFGRNLPRLVEAAHFIEMHVDTSAFFDFAYRKQIEDANYAATIMLIASDPKFCGVLVSGRPWEATKILRALEVRRLHSRYAEKFVQELARAAIIHPQSMMAREVGYVGFSNNPILSNALFGNIFICEQYTPFDGLRFSDFDDLASAKVKRLRSAATLALRAVLESKTYQPARNLLHLRQTFEWVLMTINQNKTKLEFGADSSFDVHSCVREMVEMTRKHLNSLPPKELERQYVVDPGKPSYGAVGVIAQIAFEFFASIANDFERGDDERFWGSCLEMMWTIFPEFEKERIGLDPLQQMVAARIVGKLKDNMDGYYPAVSRIVLATLGPIATNDKSSDSAREILKRASYGQLKRFGELARKKPEKVSDYLPWNVRYDAASNSLIWTYRDGRTKTIDLGSLDVANVSLDMKAGRTTESPMVQLEAVTDHSDWQQKPQPW